MSARGFASVVIVLLALTGCEDNARSASKTDLSSAANIATALNTCAQNHTGFARDVCGNQTLAGLDAQVQRILVSAAGNVSDAGAQLLVTNEGRWLEAQRIACGVAESATPLTADQSRCLESQLRARAQQVQTAVQQLSGYTFQRMELVDSAPITPAMAQQSGLGADAPAAIVRDIRFPRIDGRQTPEIQRFNDLVAQQPSVTLDEATNEIVDYRIVYAGPELISVRFDMSQDALGAAHPSSSSKAVTVLMGEGRELTENDVFRPDSRWQDFITQRAVADLTRQFQEDGFTPPERDVRETATKPHLWLISERGLTMLFPPYSFGAPYVMGGADVTIPWADLRPYLNPAAPLPIRPSA